MAKQKTWRQIIDTAKRRGHFTAEDMRLAGPAWTTCAVGEHRGQYRASGLGRPHSATLTWHGTTFYLKVVANEIAAAEEAYERIQRWFARYGKKEASA